MFDETPKVDFTVSDSSGKTIYRDSIIFDSMSELRNTSTAERTAMFQARYDAWQATVAQMTAEANAQQEAEQTEAE
jgi:hypothetical protein